MFLRFFRSGFVTQYLAIGIIGLLLWGRAFIDPPAMPAPDGPVPMYSLIYSLLHSLPHVAVILGFILTLASAYLLNRLLTRNEVLLKNSSLSSLIFIALMSYFPFLLTLHQVSIAALFLLMILERLYRAYSRSESLELTYVAGFMIGIASLFYLPFIRILYRPGNALYFSFCLLFLV
jgi:putative flippase GtrA